MSLSLTPRALLILFTLLLPCLVLCFFIRHIVILPLGLLLSVLAVSHILVVHLLVDVDLLLAGECDVIHGASSRVLAVGNIVLHPLLLLLVLLLARLPLGIEPFVNDSSLLAGLSFANLVRGPAAGVLEELVNQGDHEGEEGEDEDGDKKSPDSLDTSMVSDTSDRKANHHHGYHQ